MLDQDMQKFFEEEGKRRHQLLVKKHAQLNRYAKKGEIVFVGSSLMEDFPIAEMALTLPGHPVIYNRGIGGDVTEGLMARLDSAVIDLQPAKVFINIGTNDISAPTYNIDGLFERYEAILDAIEAGVKGVKTYIMSYYPVNRDAGFDTSWFGARTNPELIRVNARLKEMAERRHATYIDVFTPLLDENGNLKEDLTVDGMHMYPDGYKIVLDVLLPYLQ